MAVTVTYVGTNTSSSSGTTHTFTNEPVGVASPTRSTVVTVVIIQQGGGTTPPTSVTIGGVAATADVTQFATADDGNGNRSFTGIYRLANPAGTTATIVANLANTGFDCVIGVYAIDNVDSVTDTASAGGINIAGPPHDVPVSVDTVVDGAVIAAAIGYNTNGPLTWTGVTEDGTANLYGPTVDHRSWASAGGTAAATPRTVSVNYPVSLNFSASAVSYAPGAAAGGAAKQMHHRQQMAAA